MNACVAGLYCTVVLTTCAHLHIRWRHLFLPSDCFLMYLFTVSHLACPRTLALALYFLSLHSLCQLGNSHPLPVYPRQRAKYTHLNITTTLNNIPSPSPAHSPPILKSQSPHPSSSSTSCTRDTTTQNKILLSIKRLPYGFSIA